MQHLLCVYCRWFGLTEDQTEACFKRPAPIPRKHDSPSCCEGEDADPIQTRLIADRIYGRVIEVLCACGTVHYDDGSRCPGCGELPEGGKNNSERDLS